MTESDDARRLPLLTVVGRAKDHRCSESDLKQRECHWSDIIDDFRSERSESELYPCDIDTLGRSPYTFV